MLLGGFRASFKQVEIKFLLNVKSGYPRFFSFLIVTQVC